MSKRRSNCLRVLPAFSVAIPLKAARAQTDPPSQSPGSSQQEPSPGCASGDITDCRSPQTPQGSSREAGGGSFGAFLAINPGAPNAPMPVYRDDAGNIDRANESRQHPSTPAKPQSSSEFQMLVAGFIGRIVPRYGADLSANVPDTFAPLQRLRVTPHYVIGAGHELLIRTWRLYELLLRGEKSKHVNLETGDVIYFPAVGPKVAVVGGERGRDSGAAAGTTRGNRVIYLATQAG